MTDDNSLTHQRIDYLKYKKLAALKQFIFLYIISTVGYPKELSEVFETILKSIAEKEKLTIVL